MTSLREAMLDTPPVRDEDDLRAVIDGVGALTEADRRQIRERARKAADSLEREAAETVREIGKDLSMSGRMRIAHALDQAQRLRATADAMERK